MSAANATEISVVVACVFALLAIVAWASAWKTMEWLGDAEDIIEAVCDANDAESVVPIEAYHYMRRTPPRSR